MFFNCPRCNKQKTIECQNCGNTSNFHKKSGRWHCSRCLRFLAVWCDCHCIIDEKFYQQEVDAGGVVQFILAILIVVIVVIFLYLTNS
jgi:hypothetical protein